MFLWRVRLLLVLVLSACRSLRYAVADDLDEEDLAHLDSLGEDDYVDDYEDDYFDPYQADMMGGVDLAELFGEGIDEEMLEALFGGGGGDIEGLLESLGLHVEGDGDFGEEGSVKLVDGDEDEDEDYFEQAEL